MRRRMFIPWLMATIIQATAAERPQSATPPMKESALMKLFIFARFHAQEGKESEVASTLTMVSAATRAEAGCLGHQVFQSTKEPRLFFIHSQWANEAAFDRHIGLPHTLRFVEHIKPRIDHELDVVRTRLVDA
jgi:quinol monooxygenase YgiN